jgi:lipopolysaccharide transport system permease protein
MLKFIKNLIEYRELILSLTISGIKAKYKQSLFGIVWALLQPLTLMLISIFIFSRVMNVPSDDISYPLFVFAALLPWTLFSSGLSFAIPSLVQNITLLRKIYFPREVFIVSAILSAIFDYLIASFIFVIMLVYYQIPLSANILYFPLILFIQLVLMTGVSLIGAIVNVAFRDAERSLPILLQIWMFASPIVYSLKLIPDNYKALYVLNPLVGIIDSYRNIFLKGVAPNFYYLALSLGISLLVFSLGYFIFKKGEKVIADVI